MTDLPLVSMLVTARGVRAAALDPRCAPALLAETLAARPRRTIDALHALARRATAA